MNNSDKQFMQMAIELALDGMRKNEGGPFGALVVKDKTVIGKGNNRVLYKNDPTAHAEIEAIREACQNIKSFHLEGCTLYTLCEPCPHVHGRCLLGENIKSRFRLHQRRRG